MKTKEELNALKQKYDEVKSELRQLTDEELAQVVGGNGRDVSSNYTLYLPINAIVTNTTIVANTTVNKQIINLFPLSD